MTGFVEGLYFKTSVLWLCYERHEITFGSSSNNKKKTSCSCITNFPPSQLAWSLIIPVMQTQNLSRCKFFTYQSSNNTKGQKEVKDRWEMNAVSSQQHHWFIAHFIDLSVFLRHLSPTPDHRPVIVKHSLFVDQCPQVRWLTAQLV